MGKIQIVQGEKQVVICVGGRTANNYREGNLLCAW